jgi:hypothetical protein
LLIFIDDINTESNFRWKFGRQQFTELSTQAARNGWSGIREVESRRTQAIFRRREGGAAAEDGPIFPLTPKHSSKIADSLALGFGDRIVASVN